MACCSNPLLCQPNSTACFSILISPRHHPFSSHPPNLQNQLHFYPNLSTTNRSQLINATVPRSSYYTPPITTSDSPAKALRQLLESSGIHQGPVCFDALSSKLIERAGFRFSFTSGKCLFSGLVQLFDTVGFWYHYDPCQSCYTIL